MTQDTAPSEEPLIRRISASDWQKLKAPNGHPRFHNPKEWYAVGSTEPPEVIGTLILDRVDNDWSYVVLRHGKLRGPSLGDMLPDFVSPQASPHPRDALYYAVDMGSSIVTPQAARELLFTSMRTAAAN